MVIMSNNINKTINYTKILNYYTFQKELIGAVSAATNCCFSMYSQNKKEERKI